jgi:hypothetical protein
MQKMKIIEFGPDNKKLTKEIYRFQKTLYKNSSQWAPTLKMELLGSKLLGAKGLLRADHPFHEHAEVKYFMAKDDDNNTLGTVAAVVNHQHNQYYDEKTGFFGFFECIEDYEIARKLLDAARNWLKEQGMSTMRGPASFSSNEPIGLLIDAFDQTPFMYTPYNFPYYQNFLEKYGFKKTMDLLAELLPVEMSSSQEEVKRRERMARVVEKIKKRYNITLEDFNQKKPRRHLEEIRDIYKEAWKDNWGFVPLTEKEFEILAENLKMAADPQLVKIAYVEGKPAAFIGALPDINEPLATSKKSPQIFQLLKILWWLWRKKFTRVRLLLFGIKEEYRKMGLDAVLFMEQFADAQNSNRNYKECEISWLLETNNLVIQAGKKLNAEVYKTWRLYDYPLS